jgi:hypothetical protein
MAVLQSCADIENSALLLKIARNMDYGLLYDELAIEMVEARGMGIPVGAETYNTVLWIGRFIEAFGGKTSLIFRRDVKLCICGDSRAKDSNIRQALLDRYPRTGGGKTPQVGTMKEPGPLFGVSSHAFAALAVGHTYVDAARGVYKNHSIKVV